MGKTTEAVHITKGEGVRHATADEGLKAPEGEEALRAHGVGVALVALRVHTQGPGGDVMALKCIKGVNVFPARELIDASEAADDVAIH